MAESEGELRRKDDGVMTVSIDPIDDLIDTIISEIQTIKTSCNNTKEKAEWLRGLSLGIIANFDFATRKLASRRATLAIRQSKNRFIGNGDNQ